MEQIKKTYLAFFLFKVHKTKEMKNYNAEGRYLQKIVQKFYNVGHKPKAFDLCEGELVISKLQLLQGEISMSHHVCAYNKSLLV